MNIASPRAADRIAQHRRSRPSRISIPEKANPLAKLVFAEMKRQNVTYDELEHYSGVLRCTLKGWRGENRPNLETIEACLGALGWRLVPVPKLENLTPDAREALDVAGQHFATNDEALGAVLLALAEMPAWIAKSLASMAAAREKARAAA